jgi:hypothetical protein
MPSIRFNEELKPAFIEAHRLWLRDLPRRPGQIGGTMGTTIEGPGAIIWPGGGDPNITMAFPAEFLTHLRQHRPDLAFAELP